VSLHGEVIGPLQVAGGIGDLDLLHKLADLHDGILLIVSP
jgi:hypothetical protein